MNTQKQKYQKYGVLILMSKEIIVNGVDVSGCKYYALQEHYDIESDGLWKVCYSKDCKYSICANNYDCYYKQLKRAENQIVDLNKMIEVKEQEYEERKYYNNLFKESR